MALPDSFLQELVSRNEIENVVEGYVRLKRRGRTAVGLCPFHGEKTPSFTVYPETTSFYCFGCGAGGDVITFIRRIENLSYIDAVKFLAQRAGLRVPEDGVDDAVSRLRTRILEANRAAARFYHETLYTPAGRTGLEYYRRRGYSEHTIKRFGLGYAPDWDGLTRHMRAQGFKDDELTAAFLCARNKRQSLYDIFHHRIMIPIIDTRGNVIAFGGRVLDDSKPKYVNTSDTPAFKKTNNLFALNLAKATKAPYLILCEGYMDVIALHQAGFDSAVAALGTAFTEEHARLIARYTGEVVLVFDADDAGRKGTQRAIDHLRKTGVRIRVVSVPGSKDPDEYIRANSAEQFAVLIDRSAGDLEYRLDDLARRFDLDAAEGRVAYLQQAAALLAGLDSPIERDVYAGRLAAKLSVGKDAILAQVKQAAARRKKQQQKQQLAREVQRHEQNTRRANPDASKYPLAARAEEYLLGLLVFSPDLIPAAEKALSPGDLATAFNRELYARLLGLRREGAAIGLTALNEWYDGDGMAYITRMEQMAREGSASREQVFEYAGVILREKAKLERGDLAQQPDDIINARLEELLRLQQDRR